MQASTICRRQVQYGFVLNTIEKGVAKLLKLYKKRTLALFLITIFIMVGTAWAAVQYTDSIDCTNGGMYTPAANGTNSVTVSGTYNNSADFIVYGVNGTTADGSVLNITLDGNTSIKNSTNGKYVRFFAGGENAEINGNTTLNFDSRDGAKLARTASPGFQDSVAIAGGSAGGTVKGNTTVNVTGKLAGDWKSGNDGPLVGYVKVYGAGGIHQTNSEATELVVEGDSTVNMTADWGEDSASTALLAGPFIGKANAKGTVKGNAKVVLNTPGYIGEIYAAGLIEASSTDIEIGSTEIQIENGKVSSVLAGGALWGAGTIRVLGDTKVTATSYDAVESARIFGGGGCEVKDAKSIIEGNSYITIKGGHGIKFIYGGGQAWNNNSNIDFSTTQVSNVLGNTMIQIQGNEGIAAIADTGEIYAGCRRGSDVIGDGGTAQAIVGKNGIITFKDITLYPKDMKLKISGQGRHTKRLDTGNYESISFDSVSGDSVLVFDNVKADFSGATIIEMDRIELAPGTELKLADLGGATAIKLTGNWTNFGAPTVLTFKSAVSVPVDFSEATGITSAAFNDAKTELVVSCKNTPIAVTPATLKLEPEKSDTVKATTYAAGESVSWKSSDTAVATVDSAGKVTAVKAGIAVISATGSASKTTASCTVTVEDPAAPDPVPTPAPVTPTVVTKEDNPVTNDKDVPETVKPATPVITQATAENTTALAKSADVKEEFFAATADGNITVDPVIAKNAVKTVISDDATVDPQTIVTLPVITAAVESGKVAALAMKATGKQLGAVENNVVGDITLIKILKDETGAKFDYTAGPALYDDRSFTLKNADGNNLALTDKIDPAATYTLILFVKDNAKFDYDKTEGCVIDPVAIAMNEAATPAPGGSSSSGCNAGFGALALLGLAIIPAIRKRNK